VIFYAVLAGFFAAMLAVFYQTLDDQKPKWKLDEGLIGSNPGLGFRPMPDESNVESTLIWFDQSKKGNIDHWTHALGNFTQCKAINRCENVENLIFHVDSSVHGTHQRT
jgi:sodium/potassium-transporting ATPase subunit beta